MRNMVWAGVARDTARKIIGHKSDSVFSRYNVVDDTDLGGATESLARGEA